MVTMDLWNELRSFLQLEGAVLPTPGAIEVGDVFTIRFTARNMAPAFSWDAPLIRFKNPYLNVYRTDYARPLLPDGTPVDGYGTEMPAAVIEPGGSASLDIRLKAVNALPIGGIGDWFKKELAAKAIVAARVDPEAFLKVNGYTEVAAQIWPKISLVPGVRGPMSVAEGRRKKSRLRKQVS